MPDLVADTRCRQYDLLAEARKDGYRQGRRDAAKEIRRKDDFFSDADREGLTGAESAYLGVTDMEQLGYKAVWLMAEQEGEGSNVRLSWRYVQAALVAAREAAARTAEGDDHA